MNKVCYNVEFELLTIAATEITGISKEVLTSKLKKRPIAELRMICSNILKENIPKINLYQIGELFNINHATVIYHLKIHSTLMGQRDGLYKIKYQNISDLYRRRILMVGEHLSSKLLDKKNKLEKELMEINEILETLEKDKKKFNS